MLLVLDNYDSFTWNLVQLLGELGEVPRVVRNDELSVEEIERMGADRIVISPGPCTPAEAGVSVEVVRRLGERTPILGVCLGHQAIGAAFGAAVVRGPKPMHGKVTPIEHDGRDVFAGLPTPLHVTRYHSLVVDPGTLPPELEAVAWSEEEGGERVIQALRHRTRPIRGVQFHPESIASEGGRELLANFLAL